jgi:hypothetical protein
VPKPIGQHVIQAHCSLVAHESDLVACRLRRVNLGKGRRRQETPINPGLGGSVGLDLDLAQQPIDVTARDGLDVSSLDFPNPARRA